MTDIPHFDFPFRFDSSGHAMVAEQDTLEDVTNCVQAVLLTRQGDRMEDLSFGTPETIFNKQPIATDGIINAIFDAEPRAHIVIGQSPDALERLAADLTVNLSLNEEVSQ